MSLERDIMARFIELADRQQMPLNYQPGFLIRYREDGSVAGTERYPDDCIDSEVADSYRVAREAAERSPQLAYQSAMSQYTAIEARAVGTIMGGWNTDPSGFNLQVSTFVAFCSVCVFRKGAEDYLELERHHETGSEADD